MLLRGLGDLGADERLIMPGEGRNVLNVDLRTTGELHAEKDHKFVSQLSTNKIHSIHKFLGKLLIHQGDTLFYDGVDTEQSFSGVFPMSAVNWLGNCYLCNGFSFLRFNGTTFSTPFVTAPDTSSIAGSQTASGKLPAGNYKYKFTRAEYSQVFGVERRDESPPGETVLEVELDADNKKITHSNLPANSTTTSLVIYRLREDSAGTYQFVAEISDGSDSYVDNIVEAELGESLVTDLYETPPIPRQLMVFNGNLYLMGLTEWQDQNTQIIDNVVFFSDDRRFSGYSADFHDVIGKTDDVVMNGLIVSENAYIFTQANVFRHIGTNARNYQQRSTRSFTGLAARNVLVNTITYGVLFLGSNRRLDVFDGSEIRDVPALRKVDRIFERNSTYEHAINWSAREQCKLTYFDQMARLAYPSGNSIVNDRVLNLDFKPWPDIRISISSYEVTAWFADNQDFVLYAGNSNGELKELNHGELRLSPTYELGQLDLGDIHQRKDWEKVLLDFDSKGVDVAVQVEIDDVVAKPMTFNKTSRGIVKNPLTSTNEDFKTIGSETNKLNGKRATASITWPAGSDNVTIYDFDITAKNAGKK
jgi:hypothetical protein